MSYLFRSEIAIENHPELSKVEITLSAPLGLEIITPSLLSAEAAGQLLYSLYHKLNYLFAYLDYQIKITEESPQIDKNTIQDNAADYVKSARAKNYAALAITDHYNVQIFPEFSQEQTEDLRIIYGCELEMLEDDLPPYIFNHNSATNQKLLTVPITALTYCIFDLETTGFFAAYNEIIEIGY
ncbi:16905_t:CDS:2, partial [Racocetra fulgida]